MEKTYNPEFLKKFFEDSFEKLNIQKKIYQPVINGLIETSLRGVDSHGIRLFPHYIKEVLGGRINKNPNFKFAKKSVSTAILDADNTFGISASTLAMEKAIKIAKDTGVGVVTVINSGHFGAAGIYSLTAAKENMIGICCTNTEPLVIPPRGKKPFLGTNALAFACPCDNEDPYCLDMATSTTNLNKIRQYQEKGKPFEEGWAVDNEGNACVDPEKEVYLTHFGDYKGFGISMIVEILCSVLTGMDFGPDLNHMFSDFKEKRHLGHFFLAIDISKFQDISKFKKRMKILSDRLRKEPSKNESEKIMVANDPEKEKFKLRTKTGIPISEIDLKNFEEIAKLLKLEKESLNYFKFIK